MNKDLIFPVLVAAVVVVVAYWFVTRTDETCTDCEPNLSKLPKDFIGGTIDQPKDRSPAVEMVL